MPITAIKSWYIPASGFSAGAAAAAAATLLVSRLAPLGFALLGALKLTLRFPGDPATYSDEVWRWIGRACFVRAMVLWPWWVVCVVMRAICDREKEGQGKDRNERPGGYEAGLCRREYRGERGQTGEKERPAHSLS
jgi:hypothetical protein